MVKMKVTATTLPRKSASVTGAPSCEVSANSGAGAIFGSGGSSDGVLRDVTGKHQQQRRQRHDHHKRQDECRPHDQLFSSRLSSLRKRQSVASAMSLLGLDLIMPTSRSRKRIESDRVLGVVLAPLVVGDVVQRLERIVVVSGEPTIDHAPRRSRPIVDA